MSLVNFGFVIDNRKCIGCHACSTACKSENDVPLGVYRTWVKTTETGAFPDTRRHFQVTRCNHCANPPCVRICPTEAMFQRADGIVEFDKNACIGCKACLQACPYDAIYIDPETHTASKCHYCAHRTDLGLEPACVVVCPEHAILAGDLNDPTSEIARTVAKEKLSVRKPEQGTAPKLFYIDGADVNLHPTATHRYPVTFAAADVIEASPSEALSAPSTRTGQWGQALRAGQAQGLPDAGPIHVGGRRAEHMVQVGYNAQHKVPWHWPVPAYLVTKAIGAGAVLFFAAFAWVSGGDDPLLALLTCLVGLFSIGATTALLVFDLEKPARFLLILRRPQWRSWLTRGAVVLMAFSGGLALWLGWWVADGFGWIGAELAERVRMPIVLANGAFAVLAATYTAFLFGQAEGRDLWQSPLLPVHMLLQSLMAGVATMLGLCSLLPLDTASLRALDTTLPALLALDLLVLAISEAMPHASDGATVAAHDMVWGRGRRWFWAGAIGLGHLVPLALLSTGAGFEGAVGLCVVVGLYCYEHAFVMAPQRVPNS